MKQFDGFIEKPGKSSWESFFFLISLEQVGGKMSHCRSCYGERVSRVPAIVVFDVNM